VKRKPDGFATHLPLLTACVLATDGPVIELGCGFWSTPILHELCSPFPGHRDGRRLLTCCANADWLGRFSRQLATDEHFFLAVDPDADGAGWARLPEIDHNWDVALVDHAPPGRRKHDLMRLADTARLVVVHDSEPHACYSYEKAFERFRYRCDDRRWEPWTTVVSNVEDLAWLKELP